MKEKAEISKLDELLDLLDSSSKDEYRSLGKRLAIPLSDFEDYIFFNPEFYTRNCIKKTDKYELILLCWEEGQETSIHCHNEQECWVHVLKGSFNEIRFIEDPQSEELRIDHEMSLEKEGVSYMNDDMGYHSLKNSAKGRAITLHLYMDPIDECQVFDEKNKCFEWKELEYYSFAGELQEVY